MKISQVEFDAKIVDNKFWIDESIHLKKIIFCFFQVGSIYGELTDSPVEPIIVKFFGIFFLFFQSSSIWGNLISSAGKEIFFTLWKFYVRKRSPILQILIQIMAGCQPVTCHKKFRKSTTIHVLGVTKKSAESFYNVCQKHLMIIILIIDECFWHPIAAFEKPTLKITSAPKWSRR